MSFGRIGLDFLGGGMEGAGAGAGVAAAMKTAGMKASPWVPLSMMAGGALQRVMAGFADRPAERMNLRLGNQQIAMNDLEIEARRRMDEEERKAKKKNRAIQDMLSGIFSQYSKLGKGATA